MRIRAALVAAALAVCGTAMAETLQIPSDESILENAPDEAPQASAPRAESLPVRGMTMQVVESRFGTPLEKLAPVGEPPITRWVYADYTVYFEGRYVIHTVPARD